MEHLAEQLSGVKINTIDKEGENFEFEFDMQFFREDKKWGFKVFTVPQSEA